MIRPLPGVRRLSLLRQQAAFRGSARYWERNYAGGGTSGAGSYDALAQGKAVFQRVRPDPRNRVDHRVRLRRREPAVAGLLPQLHRPGRLPDRHRVVPAPVRADPAKSFFLYDGACFTDRAGVFTADLAISLDAIYHLTEDEVFETYLTHLFAAAAKYVIIYATNREIPGTPPHVRHRHFTPRVQTPCPDWRLLEVTQGPDTGPGRADFSSYERARDAG